VLAAADPVMVSAVTAALCLNFFYEGVEIGFRERHDFQMIFEVQMHGKSLGRHHLFSIVATCVQICSKRNSK